jgi:circadian clock protein KaiC
MADPRVRTGIGGLDDILCGGLPSHRVYLLTGEPGTGKTTLAMQYLLEGVRSGETCVYITLSETAEELRLAGRSHGWNLDGVQIVEVIPPAEMLGPDDQYTIFHPAEVELGETTKRVFTEVQQRKPTRLVFDSLAELRLLAHDPLRYRRQILALKQFFVNRNCTVLLIDDRGPTSGDAHLESIAHGVMLLERMPMDYGGARRRLQVTKMRGVALREGYHDFNIGHGGVEVFPRLIAAEHREVTPESTFESGVPEIDRLVGGGLDSGTSTLVIGPAGSGKSTIAQQYAVAAAERGDRAALFLFEEIIETTLRRADGLGLTLRAHVDAERIALRQVDPAQLSPGEFVHLVRHAVDVDGARLVVIDSLNGYLNAMPEERLLVVQMHELLSYLNQRGVLTILVMSQHGMLGPMKTPVDVTYLADTVMLMRFYEARGAVHKAISIVKKRTGRHETTIRGLTLGPGIREGEPLSDFTGIMTGVPLMNLGEK